VEPAITPTVTASSVMLAAFGFAYNALKGNIDHASDLESRSEDSVILASQRKALDRGAGTAAGLAAVAAAIFLVLLKLAVNEVEAAFRVNFSLHHYSALDIIFVLLTATWLLIAIGLAVKAGSLVKKKTTNYKKS
jgi:hypothetical protein